MVTPSPTNNHNGYVVRRRLTLFGLAAAKRQPSVICALGRPLGTGGAAALL